MTGREHALLDELQQSFLVPEDFALCTRLVDRLVRDRNPACVLSGHNPLLQRHYARLLCKVMLGAGHHIRLCPTALHTDIAAFLTLVAADNSIEQAIQTGTGNSSLLVFRHAVRIKPEELVLLREVQRSFSGLGLAYLYLAGSDAACEGYADNFVLDPALDFARMTAASSVKAATTKRRLQRVMRPVESP